MTGLKRYHAFCQVCGPVGSPSLVESGAVYYQRLHETGQLDPLHIALFKHKCVIETYYSFSRFSKR